MSNLSTALKKYYTREKKKIVFQNSQSLNQLALSMWEQLGYQQIDPSVLSKVINGERLFTSNQLKVFSHILNLNKTDEEYLSYCLANDYNKKNNLSIDFFLLPAATVYEVIKKLNKDSGKSLSEGNYQNLESISNLAQSLIDSSKFDESTWDAKIEELHAYNVYIQGRYPEASQMPHNIIKKTSPFSIELLKLAKKNNSRLMFAYANILLSNAYYIAGGYSYANNKSKFYDKALVFGKQALDNLDDTNNEKLFVLRVMAASASYNKDVDTTRYIFNKVKKILYMQPMENYANTLHVCSTLSRGLALSGIKDPFLLKKSAINYFKHDLTNAGIYEVSDIKTQIDTLLILETNDKNYILNRIKRGIEIAQKNNFTRHIKYFDKIIKEI